ncbi:MAG: Uncharacterised protein [Synechococcus sp. CC9902]|nr:MAG: Uncharacterised protein [Synechococcus sp. CC9902]
MIFERFQGCRDCPCPGLSIRKGSEMAALDFSNRTNRAEHELPIRELTLGRNIQTHRQSIDGLAHLEAAGFGQSRCEQCMPGPSETKRLRSVTQPQIQAVALPDALRNGWSMHPEAGSAITRFHMNSWKRRCILDAPTVQQKNGLFREIRSAFALR